MKNAFYAWVTDAATRAAAEMTPDEARAYLSNWYANLGNVGADECIGFDAGGRARVMRAVKTAWHAAVEARSRMAQ